MAHGRVRAGLRTPVLVAGERDHATVGVGHGETVEARIDAAERFEAGAKVGAGTAGREALGEIVGGDGVLIDQVVEALRDHLGALAQVRATLRAPRCA